MTSVVLTTTGAGTWQPPAECVAGTRVNVETWGGGSGGSGTGSTQGGGGAGAPYASRTYTITPNDVASGVALTIGIGGAGNTGVGSVGGDTSFSTNNLNLVRNSVNQAAAVGVPGTLPTNWSTNFGAITGLSTEVVAFGTDPSTGLPYLDLRTSGIPSASGTLSYFADSSMTAGVATYVASGYFAVLATGTQLTNVATPFIQYLSLPSFSNPGFANFTLTNTVTRQSCSGANPAGSTGATICIGFAVTISQAIDITVRMSGWQFELAGSPTFFKSTPGYTLAKGGAAPITTSGGVGTATGCIGDVTSAGGSGRNYNAAGSGGGGAGGKDGAGATATTSTGGTGDNGSGGAANTANVEGGGGGTASTANGGTGTAGGAPGGGGGGSDGASGTRTGGAGGRGQIRLTFLPVWFPMDARPDLPFSRTEVVSY